MFFFVLSGSILLYLLIYYFISTHILYIHYFISTSSFIKSILEFHLIFLTGILFYFCVGMGSQELWATMCTLDFPVVERFSQPVPWCLGALLLMPSEGISLCLLWLLE